MRPRSAGESRRATQRSGEPKRPKQCVQRIAHVDEDGVRRTQRFRSCAFGAEHGESKRRGLQHPAIVSPVSHRDDTLGAEAAYVARLGAILVARGENFEAAGAAAQLQCGAAERVRSHDVDAQVSRKSLQARPDSREQAPVAAECAVEVKHQMRERGFAPALDSYFDHQVAVYRRMAALLYVAGAPQVNFPRREMAFLL